MALAGQPHLERGGAEYPSAVYPLSQPGLIHFRMTSFGGDKDCHAPCSGAWLNRG